MDSAAILDQKFIIDVKKSDLNESKQSQSQYLVHDSTSQRIVKIKKQPIIFGDKKCYMILLRDYTKEIEIEQKESLYYLQDKISSHEAEAMRNPLKIILQAISVLKGNVRDS